MTKREHQPITYDPTLDRRQPPGLPCVGIVGALFVLVLAVVPVVWGVSMALPHDDPPIPTLAELPTETPTEVPTETLTPMSFIFVTPDEWGRTGTALARQTPSATPTPTGTLNYCWWQTPSPTPTPTLMYTPDGWGSTGTAVYLATYPYATPTPQPPRELCDHIPTWTSSPTERATLTPLPLPGWEDSTEEILATPIGGFPTMPAIEAPATWTRQPAQPPAPIIQIIEVTVPPPAPIVIEVTAPPPAPIVIQVVITATPAPTDTPTPTSTPTLTHTPTPTSTSTNSPTPTPTSTATATATETPTSTPTAAETETPA